MQETYRTQSSAPIDALYMSEKEKREKGGENLFKEKKIKDIKKTLTLGLGIPKSTK